MAVNHSGDIKYGKLKRGLKPSIFLGWCQRWDSPVPEKVSYGL
jgi:hypothetical protein